MPSPRNLPTTLPVILDKPSRHKTENISHFNNGYRKEHNPLGRTDSDLSQIRNIFHSEVSTVKAGALLNVPATQDDVDVDAVGRARTCMPQITADRSLTSNKKTSNCPNAMVRRKESTSGPSSGQRAHHHDDSPQRVQGQDVSPARVRRSRTRAKYDWEYEENKAYDADVDITRRSSHFTERNKDRKRKSVKAKTYPRLTRDALTSEFTTPLPRHSRIFNWLMDCKGTTDDSVPDHLPDISLTWKYKNERE